MIHCLTSEFHVKFHLKNGYRTHRFAIRAISVFSREIKRGIHSSGSEFFLNRIAKATKSPGETKRIVFL